MLSLRRLEKCPSALSYVHIVIPVNISKLSMAFQHFHDKVTLLQKGYVDKEKYTFHLEKYGGQINTNASVFFHISHLLDLMLRDANNLQGSLSRLQSSLP